MENKYWACCLNCGTTFRVNSLRTQFCCEKCLDSWTSCENNKIFAMSRNYGQKDKTKYNKWRRSVRKKFNNKCAICGRTKDLHAHHIVKWSDNVELRYKASNGLLLCCTCHSIIHGHSIGCSTSVLNSKELTKETREKYIKITNITFDKVE